jgi:hypothetical protein
MGIPASSHLHSKASEFIDATKTAGEVPSRIKRVVVVCCGCGMHGVSAARRWWICND